MIQSMRKREHRHRVIIMPSLVWMISAMLVATTGSILLFVFYVIATTAASCLFFVVIWRNWFVHGNMRLLTHIMSGVYALVLVSNLVFSIGVIAERLLIS